MIEEINRVIALTDSVKKRKEEDTAATPHLCAEGSHSVTESWKETEGEPLDIRRPKAFKKVMEGISVVIREGELGMMRLKSFHRLREKLYGPWHPAQSKTLILKCIISNAKIERPS